MAIADDLDLVQQQLQDGGRLWSRAELLLWYVTGYRRLLTATQAARQLVILDTPPRYTIAATYPWERSYSLGGSNRHWTYTGEFAQVNVTALWHLEQALGVAPTAHLTSCTQLWELAYVGGDVDTHYRFALPHQHDRTLALWWDHKRLSPVSVRELDALEDAWWQRDGDPYFWTAGLGNVRSLEIYEIDNVDEQVYTLTDTLGGPRSWTGERLYSVEGDADTIGYAYTTDGDAEALTQTAWTFAYRSAYTDCGDIGGYYADEADLPDTFLPTYQWTLSGDYPYQCTQPWEVDRSAAATGGQRGQFPWAQACGSLTPPESRSPAGQFLLKGAGLQVTYAAVSTYQALYAWEYDMLSGATTLTDASTIGTAPWEADFGATNVGAFAMGSARRTTSPDRQYLPADTYSIPYGVPRSFASSAGNLLVHEAIVPDDALVLTEHDAPVLLPAPLSKYLRFYTLFQAFNRQGVGYEPSLAKHFLDKYRRGEQLLQKLGDVSWRAHTWQRGPVSHTPGRVPRPQLPADYPRVPWLG